MYDSKNKFASYVCDESETYVDKCHKLLVKAKYHFNIYFILQHPTHRTGGTFTNLLLIHNINFVNKLLFQQSYTWRTGKYKDLMFILERHYT